MHLFVLILYLSLTTAECERAINALSGTEVTMLCHSSTTSPIIWIRIARNSADEVDIYTGSEVTKEFADKFRAQRTGEMDHSLTLLVATVDDSGNYSCIEEEGFSNRRHTTQLMVQGRIVDTQATLSSTDDYGTEQPSAAVPAWLIAVITVTVLALVVVVAAIIVCKFHDKFHGHKDRTTDNAESGTGLPLVSSQRDDDKNGTHVIRHEHLVDPTDVQIAARTSDGDSDFNSKPKLVKSIRTEQDVAAVTCNIENNGDVTIYFVCYGSDTIQYFGVDYKITNCITVSGLQAAVDMVFCPCVRGLYIVDSGPHCLWRQLLTGGNPQHLDLNSPPISLSLKHVTEAVGRLIVSTTTGIRTYDCDLKMPTEVRLANEVRPLHSVQTATDTFVVCHAKGISEFDVNGKLIRSRTFDSIHLLFPCYMALDPENEHIFVADMGKDGCISKLNSDLQIVDDFVIGERDEVTMPRRLCYESGWLFVTQSKNRVIHIFKF